MVRHCTMGYYYLVPPEQKYLSNVICSVDTWVSFDFISHMI